MGGFLLYYGVIIPFSYLPFWILYFISDIIFIVVYHVIGYRRKVVFSNLAKSFPDKSEKELKKYEREFYRHLSDLVVESIKTFTISSKASLKRMRIKNPEVPNKFFEQGKSIVTIGGHNGNWELYAVACAMQIKHHVAALYTPMSNKFFDKVMRKSRSRFGLNMVPTTEKDKMLEDREEPTMYIFGIDQCPRKSQRAYWMEFLNQETAVQFGAEKFARKHQMPVVFGNIRKLKRGYYEIEYKVVCEDPSVLETGAIVERGTKNLEDSIKRQPAYWLWSHKRWKYGRGEYVSN